MWISPPWVGSKDLSFLREPRRSNSITLTNGLTGRHRSAYYILCSAFPIPTRTDEEDKASWAIVGHEAGSPSTPSTPSPNGVEKAVEPVSEVIYASNFSQQS